LKNKFLYVCLLITVFVCLKPISTAFAAVGINQEENPLLQFPVISDIHIGEEYQKERFSKALRDFQILAPNYQAIAMVGDITNHGAVQEYQDFNQLLNSNMNQGAEKIITMGNHEYFEGLSSSTGLDKDLYMKRFITMTGMPEDKAQIYYDKWIQGYHFITLGGEGFSNPDDQDHANITDTQYNWLRKTLPQKAEPAKPIFVFLHQAIDNTVYGSELWGAGLKDSRLKDILRQYPQVILFSGHSHYLLNHPRTVFQDGFTMVNSGAIAYTYSDSGSHLFSQGLLVNVYQDRVDIKARDFTNNTWLQTFTVKTPFKKTFGDLQDPFFNPNALAKVDKNNTGDTVTISWDAAIDNTLVDKYVIKNNGKVIYTKYPEFWKNNAEAGKLTAELSNLSEKTDYNLSITAVDAWNNESKNHLTAAFKTPRLSGWRWEEAKWRYYKNGLRVTGWQEIDQNWYLFLSDTSMYTGWYKNGSMVYFLNNNGVMQMGWKEINGKYYYFGSDGSAKTGWLLYQGKWYYLKSDGMLAGWQLLDNNSWYYFDQNGAMKTGWLQLAGKWYFLDQNGVMKTNWIALSGKWYFLDSNGVMKTGWVLSKNEWYYLKASGAMLTGWLLENGKWYYLKADGSLARNTTIEGYVFGNDGGWINK
jgi:glucan-binding YG repeat protein/predicted phosphodiesterase